MRLPLVIAIVITISFISFQPRILNYLFAPSRESYLNQLLSNTSRSHHLDPQEYWETREFYFPGVFHVYQDGLVDSDIQEFSAKTGLTPVLTNTFPILVYSSSKWNSYESLVNTDKLADIINIPTATPIYEDAETRIYQIEKKTYLFFIKPYEELKITNGFIYTKDEILKNYRYWFGVSVTTK